MFDRWPRKLLLNNSKLYYVFKTHHANICKNNQNIFYFEIVYFKIVSSLTHLNLPMQKIYIKR